MRTSRFLLTVLLLMGGLALSAGRARAEDGDAPPDDPRAKLKAQAEKVLRLMRENEAALLEASTLGGAAPKGPEVPVPDVPPAPAPQGSGSEGGGSPAGGTRGEEIRKRLEELIKGQQAGAGKIPDGLAEIIQLIPKSQGPGSGGPPPPTSTGSEGEMTPEARDAQRKKELQEQQDQQKGKDGKDPKSGEKDEPNADGRPPSETDVPPQDPSNPDAKPWDARLPPEMRTSESGGGLERLPGRLGQIIEDYLKNLQRQTTPGGASR